MLTQLKPLFMKMNQFIILLAVQLVSWMPLKAQEVFLEIKTELTGGDVKFKWTDRVINDSNQSSFNRINNNFSIGVSAKVWNKIYLKSTIGSSDFQNQFDVTWYDGTLVQRVLGQVRVYQNFMEILPEFRPLKNRQFFVNAGLGFTQIKRMEKMSGFYQIRTSFDVTNRSTFPDFRTYYGYLACNVGGSFAYKKVGFLLETGFRFSGYTKKGEIVPGLGVNQGILKLGVSYQLS
ncbi:MAG: hypothetical protein AAGJ18_07390 [Bacteroidota bacterium]